MLLSGIFLPVLRVSYSDFLSALLFRQGVTTEALADGEEGLAEAVAEADSEEAGAEAEEQGAVSEILWKPAPIDRSGFLANNIGSRDVQSQASEVTRRIYHGKME